MTERICSHPPCSKPVHAHGLCSGHRAQRRRGKPLGPIKPKRRTLAERFYEKVDKTETCWLWLAATNHLGYGQIYVTAERRVVMAHRVALLLAGRPARTDEDVDHLCRVRACVNPEHLEAVSHAINMARAPYSAPDFQSIKTHCPQGHEYTESNTRHKVNSSGTLSRECKMCLAEAQRRYRARKRAGLVGT